MPKKAMPDLLASRDPREFKVQLVPKARPGQLAQLALQVPQDHRDPRVRRRIYLHCKRRWALLICK